jgi:peptidoglycan hydrolase-like protein with peptidoglycan-binding domain
MARTLFRRAAQGHRLVRGEPVRRVQGALQRLGFDPLSLDGIFGGDTENAVRAWQTSAGATELTGAVSFDDWQTLVREPPPALRDRALQLTADFEQHGFGKIAGNFDGAWLTWGIIGYTLRHGELQRILNEIERTHPALLDEAFGPRRQELMNAIHGPPAAQEAFANRISIGRKRTKVEPEWAEAFAVLGAFPEVQAIELRGVDAYWDLAARDVERFGLETELGLALCFDIAVQNGGIDFQTEENSIRRRLAQNPPADETVKRTLIADVVAENSKPEYVADVRERKRAIATGRGVVHGASYDLEDWGFEDVPVADRRV